MVTSTEEQATRAVTRGRRKTTLARCHNAIVNQTTSHCPTDQRSQARTLQTFLHNNQNQNSSRLKPRMCSFPSQSSHKHLKDMFVIRRALLT